MIKREAITIDSENEEAAFSDVGTEDDRQIEVKLEQEEADPVDDEIIPERYPNIREQDFLDNVDEINGEQVLPEDTYLFPDDFTLKKTKRRKTKDKDEKKTGKKLTKGLKLSKEELKVVESDIPERIQRIYGRKPSKFTAEEIESEAIWIFNEISDEFHSDDNEVNLIDKIKLFLDFVKNQYLEVIFIYTYRFNQLSGMTLENLWSIYNKDLEYTKIQRMRIELSDEIKEDIKDSYKRGKLENLLNRCKNMSTLESFPDYIGYFNFISDANKSKFIHEILDLETKLYYKSQDRIHYYDCISKISLTPDQFSENLANSSLNHKPPRFKQSVKEYFHNLPLKNQTDLISFYKAVTTIMALNFFFHPLIRQHIQDQYLKKARISTQPIRKITGQNQQEQAPIHVYNPDYCVKRIRNRPFKDFKGDSGIYLLKNLVAEKIEYKAHTQSDSSLNPFGLNTIISHESDSLINYVTQAFIDEEQEEQEQKEWNLIRKEAISLLVKFLQGYLQTEMQKQLKDRAENHITDQCMGQLYQLLNNGPCLKGQNHPIRYSGSGELFKYARVLALSKEDNNIIATVVDENGRHLDSIENLGFSEFEMLQGTQSITNINTNSHDRKLLKDLIINHKPEIVVLGDYSISRRIIRQLARDTESKYEYAATLAKNIVFDSIEIPELLLEIDTNFCWHKEDEEHSDKVRINISLARLQQDYMAEMLKLWDDDLEKNKLLDLQFDDLQKYVDKKNLCKKYEQIIQEAVNRVGVDINELVQNHTRAAPLQFICGFGPLRANQLLITTPSHSLFQSRLLMRKQASNCMKDKVFFNCSGFLKVEVKNEDLIIPQQQEPLDRCRINVEMYNITKIIVRDAFKDLRGIKSDMDIFQKAKNFPDTLDEIDLEDFSKFLFQKHNRQNMRPLLEMIIDELKDPFEDPRKPYSELDYSYLFFKMIGVARFEFQSGSIVPATVAKVHSSYIEVKLKGGIECSITQYDILDKEQKQPLSAYFYEGQKIICRIMKFSFESFKTDFCSNIKLNLCLKESVLNDHREYFIKLHPTLDSYNIVDINDDYPVLISNKRQNANFKDRLIMHNKFKNISATEAMQYLQNSKTGDFVFRPGRTQETIHCTWKLYDDSYVHIDINERLVLQGNDKIRTLEIGKKKYSSINEIIAHYINKCNKTIKEITEHKKFHQGDAEALKQVLALEKEADPTVIPYHVGIIKDIGQHAILIYHKHHQAVTEYIRIENEGLIFHDFLFISLDHLLNYFKKNCNSIEYTNYVRLHKPPVVDIIPEDSDEDKLSTGNVADDNWFQSDFDSRTRRNKEHSMQTLAERDNMRDPDSIKVKQEKIPNIICENCGNRGHNQSQCPVPSDSMGFDGSDRKQYRKEENQWGSSNGKSSYQKKSSNSWGEPSEEPSNGGGGWGNTNQSSSNTTKGGWGSNEETKTGGASSSWGNDDTGGSAWGTSKSGNTWGESKSSNAWGESKSSNSWGTSSKADEGNGASSAWGSKNNSERKRDGGGNSGRACFKCGEEGHFSRECPNASAQSKPKGGGGSRACFKCGEEGHFSRECPNASAQSKPSGGSRACFKCGQEGHFSRECPNPGTGSGRKRACFNCGEEDHSIRDCPHPRKERRDKSRSRSNEKRRSRAWGNNSSSGGDNSSWGGERKSSGWGESKQSGGWGNSSSSTGGAWGGSSSNDQTANSGGGGWGNSSANNNSANDGWGAGGQAQTYTNDGWGSETQHKTQPVNDGWGSGPSNSTQPVSDGWGAPAQTSNGGDGGWGAGTQNQTSTTHAQPANDGWGAGTQTQANTTISDGWGAPTQTTNNNNGANVQTANKTVANNTDGQNSSENNAITTEQKPTTTTPDKVTDLQEDANQTSDNQVAPTIAQPVPETEFSEPTMLPENTTSNEEIPNAEEQKQEQPSEQQQLEMNDEEEKSIQKDEKEQITPPTENAPQENEPVSQEQQNDDSEQPSKPIQQSPSKETETKQMNQNLGQAMIDSLDINVKVEAESGMSVETVQKQLESVNKEENVCKVMNENLPTFDEIQNVKIENTQSD